MGVALGREAGVARPAVGRHLAGACDVLAEEADQAPGRDVGDRVQPQPTQPAAARLAAPALDRAGDPYLAGGAAARLAGPRAADLGLVGLDPLTQRLAPRPDHGATDLVQPAPSGLIAAKAHLALEFHRRDATLARAHQIDGEEPPREAGLGLLEDRAGEDRVLPAAGRALLDQSLLVALCLIVAAAAAAKAGGPARLHQIGPTLGIGAETLEEGRQIPRQVLDSSSAIAPFRYVLASFLLAGDPIQSSLLSLVES